MAERVSAYEDYFKLGQVTKQVAEHERRLEGINGSIDGLRDDVNERMGVWDEKLTSVFVWMKVAFILGQVLTPVIVGVVVYMIFR